jgi:hypothetical protein
LNIDDSLYKDEWVNNWVLAGDDLSMINGPEAIVVKVEPALFNNKPQQR